MSRFRLSDIFKRSEPTTAVKIPLSYSRLSLRDWQASPERVSYVQGLFTNPLFLDLVAMLANVRPVQSRETTDPTSAAIALGRRMGHDDVIVALLAASTSPPAPQTDVPIDYAAANVMANWETEGTSP